MREVIAAIPAYWLLGAGLGLGAVALLVAGGVTLWRFGRVRLLVQTAMVGAGLAGLLWAVSPYLAPPRHAALSPMPRSCAEARMMGFGTARQGTPGYFAHLDADRDGTSCEPMPPGR